MGLSVVSKPEVALRYTTPWGLSVQSIGEEDQMLPRNTFGSEMYLWYKSRDVVPTREIGNLQGPILWIHRSILGTGQPITTELKDETTQG